MYDINESDCCGNGCANCVLDIQPTKSLKADKSGKKNILQKYTKFLLINKTLHQPQVKNVWELHFRSEQSDNKDFILDINAGYHLMMRKPYTENQGERNDNDENELAKERKYLLRPYSPYWWDTLEMEFKILVNLIPQGPMSKYIEQLKIEDKVEFRGPIGTFEHEPDIKGENCVIIITQGVAVAPVIPIIEEILNNEDDMTRIIHIGCFQDLNHIYFRDKLYNYNKFWNYKVNIYLSRELCDKTDCRNNLRCLETCKNFKSKLKYKESIKSLRFDKRELEQIFDTLKHKKDNISIVLAGVGKFQNYFKELCQQSNWELLDNKIYLL